MKKVLVFGSGGFVGNYISKEFADSGYEVYGTDVLPNYNYTKYIVKYYKLDIMDADGVYELIKTIKPYYIINLAAVSSVGESWKKPQRTIEINVNGSLNILDAVRKLKYSTRILMIGSSEEYAVSSKKIAEDYKIDANNPYGISKIMQEKIIDLYRTEYGLDIISTRTFNHTGVGQIDKFAIPSFIKQVVSVKNKPGEKKIMVGNLNVHRDIGDVRDMVRAYRLILEGNSKQHVFNVGSGKCYLLDEIVDYIVGLTGQSIEKVEDKSKVRPIDNNIVWCDNALIKKELGWTPLYTVYDAIDLMYYDMIKDE